MESAYRLPPFYCTLVSPNLLLSPMRFSCLPNKVQDSSVQLDPAPRNLTPEALSWRHCCHPARGAPAGSDAARPLPYFLLSVGEATATVKSQDGAARGQEDERLSDRQADEGMLSQSDGSRGTEGGDESQGSPVRANCGRTETATCCLVELTRTFDRIVRRMTKNSRSNVVREGQ